MKPFSSSRLLCLLMLTICAQVQASIPPAKTIKSSMLSFRIEAENEYDQRLISRLEKYSVFERLQLFSNQDLQLKRTVTYRFHKELDNEDNSIVLSIEPVLNIFIPFSFLYQLDQGLLSKYPEQPQVVEAIYSMAVEKYLWFELGRAVIDQFELGITGKEVFALDNFSTLMLLNQNSKEIDYILDATEAFLLLDQAIPYGRQKDYDAEISLDEQRYRKAVCLILGKDYLAHLTATNQPYQKLLQELAWDQEKIEQCKKLYMEKLENWLHALEPFLRKDSRLRNLLAAQ